MSDKQRADAYRQDAADSVDGKAQSHRRDAVESRTGALIENPKLAVLLALGAGAGIGLVIGTLLARPANRSCRMSRRCNAELGRQVASALAAAAPNLFDERLQK